MITWLNQQQMAELFATSKQTISYHIINILKERELDEISVVKEYLTTAADGKNYNVVFYSLVITGSVPLIFQTDCFLCQESEPIEELPF